MQLTDTEKDELRLISEIENIIKGLQAGLAILRDRVRKYATEIEMGQTAATEAAHIETVIKHSVPLQEWPSLL